MKISIKYLDQGGGGVSFLVVGQNVCQKGFGGYFPLKGKFLNVNTIEAAYVYVPIIISFFHSFFPSFIPSFFLSFCLLRRIVS
jgi:hypothetical protein